MTWSIIARDPSSGQIGAAVASRFFAAGAVVLYTRGNCAIATQAFANPMYGVEGLGRLAGGQTAAALIADFTARDRGAGMRQVHMLDAAGNFARHTGADCVAWAGHQAGRDCSVAGNMLAGPDVVSATRAAFEAEAGLALPERLLAAMEAGERAGGDIRGRQAAGLKVHRGEDWPWIDIRTDDHADPLSELRRLLAVADERYLHFVEALPTRSDFSGLLDRTPLDAAIKAAEERRAKAGIASVSFATPLV